MFGECVQTSKSCITKHSPSAYTYTYAHQCSFWKSAALCSIVCVHSAMVALEPLVHCVVSVCGVCGVCGV